MNQNQPDPYHWSKPHLIRMFIGINIYHDAMRRYIGKKLRSKFGDSWFRNGVIDVIENEYRIIDLEHRLNAEKRVSGSEEKWIEVRDILYIVSAAKNRDVFPIQLHYLAIKKQMKTIHDQRNNWAHPPMDDCGNTDADTALDCCACVLRQADPIAADQVRILLNNPDLLRYEINAREKLKQELKEGKQESKDAEKGKLLVSRRLRKDEQSDTIPALRRRLQNANLEKNTEIQKNDKLRQQLNVEKQRHEKTQDMLETTERELNTTKRNLNKTKEAKEKAQAMAEQRWQQLKKVTQQPATASHQWETRHQWAQTQKKDLESQPPSKSVGAAVPIEVEHYRKRFRDARSGNGWTYSPPREDPWLVTRWVGRVQGELRACVFSPSQKLGSEWVSATERPLIYHKDCKSKEEAFAYLQRAEQSGEIERRAHKAIEEYNALFSMPDSVLDSGPDNDIPF